MLKKLISSAFAAVMICISVCGCGMNVNEELDQNVNSFNKDYNDYLKDHEKLLQSVLDTLNLMLDNYVSGTATPPSNSIVSNIVPPGGQDAQDIIDNTSDTLQSESELIDKIHEAVTNFETDFSFEDDGGWCTDELLYEVIFEKVHDVYMIDAFGLQAYSYSVVHEPSGNDVYQINFIYLDGLSTQDIAQMRSDIERKAKDIVLDLNLGALTEYEKIEAINNYLCDSVYYPDQPFIDQDFTPYGALIDGRAVCDGYARATKILADMGGLECLYVSGYCGQVGHAWNLVKIDNNYYQLDVTWNDTGSTDDYFLTTDDFMSLSRVWDTSDYPPSASVPYNP